MQVEPSRERVRRRLDLEDLRPIHVDEQGRMFEVTGEPIVIEGLEPDKVLQALADEAAGRSRSLRAIIAERKK